MDFRAISREDINHFSFLLFFLNFFQKLFFPKMSLIGLLWIFANLVPICVKSQAAENEAYVVELFTGTKLVLEPDL